ncbi:hypothetical protein [Ornithinimicrobium sediminis]|uniref:hypothetical protein n=1 Tax=Ornithinimicrobium sediminis TaxID=2904603 RepID=UPI001E514B93|nr:hypothetical protein [Ornithinimicrobium sediminis]MCE0485879.1 hypothetical protein [Ornithinimicrobium sediminis]
MPSAEPVLRLRRAVLTALVGGVLGALVLGLGTGQLLASFADDASGRLYALAGATLAGGAGTFLGGAAALVIAFRDEAARPRVVTGLTTVVLGPILAVVLAMMGAHVVQAVVGPPVLPLGVALVLSTVAGRGLAFRLE